MSYSRLRHWVKANVLGGQITQYHPDFVKKLDQLEKMCNDTQLLIKAMRDVVYPNARWPFNPSRLTAGEYNDVTRCLQHLNGLADAFASPDSKAYLKSIAETESEIDSALALFTRQVDAYAIEPLAKFIKEDATRIKQEKKALDGMRADYDNACDYLKHSNEGNIDKKNANLDKCKEKFEKQADVIQSLLDKIPEYEERINEAIKQFVKADRQMRSAVYASLRKLK